MPIVRVGAFVFDPAQPVLSRCRILVHVIEVLNIPGGTGICGVHFGMADFCLPGGLQRLWSLVAMPAKTTRSKQARLAEW